jgi:DNA replication initiation complex subunit (GINS family)
MNLKTDYQNLYKHWLKEFETSELTPLTQETFDNYRKSVDHITKFELENKRNIEIKILDSYKQNFKYLFNDFLKIREVKILNAALILHEVDYDNVIEAEKLFYRNLISAIKGFTKLKSFSLYDIDEPVEVEEVFKEEVSSESVPVEITTEKEVEQIEVGANHIKAPQLDIEQLKQDSEYNYTVIRFISPSPPLVGIDSITYGPFKENDIVNMPFKNAKILIYEKLAEEIDVS